MYNIGLIVNPIAGVGGAVGLKGSDGAELVTEAKKRGAIPRANEKTTRCLKRLNDVKQQLRFLCFPGPMGAAVLADLGFQYTVLEKDNEATLMKGSSEKDTEDAVKLMQHQGVDLILFAGGDGTARNIYNALSEIDALHTQVVLGIPAGVKIHSGVYGVTPEASGEIVRELVQGEIVSLVEAEVRDIDEQAFRQGQVKSHYYGELKVPVEATYLQHVKSGGREVESLVLQDIAAYIIELMQSDVYYVFGPGSTTKAVTDALGLDGTLLGVDVVLNEALVAKDIAETELYQLIRDKPSRLIITVIGGQGHILGRGNQQISPRVMRSIGKENVWVVATKNKLKALERRPLLVDSGDPALDQLFNGFIAVLTGYEDRVLYPVGFDLLNGQGD